MSVKPVPVTAYTLRVQTNVRIVLVGNRIVIQTIVCHQIVFVHYLYPITDVKLHEASLADHCLSTVLVSILGVDCHQKWMIFVHISGLSFQM